MLARSTEQEFRTLTQYDRIVVYLFRHLSQAYDASTLPDEIPFTRSDIIDAMNSALADGVIPRATANPPDIKYTYDARRALPAEIEQAGHMTWLATGKGRYILKRTRRPNLLPFPNPVFATPQTELVVDQTPPFIAGLLGNDEQATFTRVRNCGLLNDALGFQIWPIQGHHRTTVSYGQIEVDEVQAGLNKNVPTIVPISGKGGADMLSWSQALNLNTYGAEKAPIAGMAVRSIGLWRDRENTIWIVEFSPSLDIDQIEIVSLRRFRIQ